MENEATLYNHFLEFKKIQELKANIEHEIKLNELAEKVNKVNAKIDRFSSLMNCMIEYQEKINNKRAATIIKVQEKSVLNSDKDYLYLSHTHHDDFNSLLSGKERLKQLVNERVLHGVKSQDEVGYIVKKIQNINSSCHKQVIESINNYTASKGFLENITQLHKLDQEKQIDEKNDSDIGCYPHDSNLNFNAIALSEIATSSPI